jgi:hypothetical protein
MPVQFKAISKLDTSRDLLRRFEEASLEVKKDVMRGLAAEVVANSPVDTGNYIMSHEIASGGRDGGFTDSPTNSHGMPRGQAKGSKAGPAMARLNAQIESIQPTDTQFMLRNSAVYAARVEYGGWGGGAIRAVGSTNAERAAVPRQPYHVYARARAAAGPLIQRALAEFEARMAMR